MDNLTKRDQPDRSKINMSGDFEVKYWLKALGVSKDELKRAVEKVGNSAAAVRKELACDARARTAAGCREAISAKQNRRSRRERVGCPRVPMR